MGKKMCPLLTKIITVHNDINDYRTLPIGINTIGNNDVTFTSFLPCMGEKCMMFDEWTEQCKYDEKKLF